MDAQLPKASANKKKNLPGKCCLKIKYYVLSIRTEAK